MNTFDVNPTPANSTSDPGSALAAKLDPFGMVPLAWATFLTAPGKNLVAGSVLIVAGFVVGIVPVVNLLLLPLIAIGFARFALRSVRREDPPLSDLFHGFAVWQGALKAFWHSIFIFFVGMKLIHPWLAHYAFVDESLDKDGTTPVGYAIAIERDNGWRLEGLIVAGYFACMLGVGLLFVGVIPMVILWGFACAHAYEYLRRRAATAGWQQI